MTYLFVPPVGIEFSNLNSLSSKDAEFVLQREHHAVTLSAIDAWILSRNILHASRSDLRRWMHTRVEKVSSIYISCKSFSPLLSPHPSEAVMEMTPFGP